MNPMRMTTLFVSILSALGCRGSDGGAEGGTTSAKEPWRPTLVFSGRVETYRADLEIEAVDGLVMEEAGSPLMEGIVAFSPPQPEARTRALDVQIWSCGEFCEKEAWQRSALEKGDGVVETKVLGPDLRIQWSRDESSDRVMVDRLLPEPLRFLLRCEARAPVGSGEIDALAKVCERVKVAALHPWVGGDLLEAERAGLAKCPQTTSIKVVGEGPTADAINAFAAFSNKVAFQTEPGKVFIRLAASGDVELVEDPTEGQKRLDVELTASPSQREVTSGRFTQGFEPPIARAALWGVSAVPGLPGPSELGGDAGSVEIFARTRKRICGAFTFTDAGTVVRGEFDVQLVVRESDYL